MPHETQQPGAPLPKSVEAKRPQYMALRSSNRRETEYMLFRADSDETAVQEILEREAAGDTDWNGVEDDNGIADAPDVEISVRRREDGKWRAIASGVRVAEDRPYTDDARALARELAALAKEGAYDDAVEKLDEMIRKARRICGLPEDELMPEEAAEDEAQAA